MEEEWREIIRWRTDNHEETTEAIVMVSSFGNLKRMPYRFWNKKNNGYSDSKEYAYKPFTNRGIQSKDTEEKISKCGLYKHVNINKKTYLVHRLVADAFISKVDDKIFINHIDGIRDNNHISNLEWCTKKENSHHAVKTGLIKSGRFKDLSDFDKSKIIEMRMQFYTTPEISKETGRSHELIRLYLNKFFDNEKYVYNRIKSFAKLLTKLESGVCFLHNKKKKYCFRHSTTFYGGSTSTIEEAIKIKDDYIKNNFDSNTSIFIKWEQLKCQKK
jgi:hypothetical protein